MGAGELHVVTGALSFTGGSITWRLLSTGRSVRTLTGHPDRPNPFSGRVSVVPFAFDNPRQLIKGLEGAGNLYNLGAPFGRAHRLPARDRDYDNPDQGCRSRRRPETPDLSVTSASEESRLPYFRGKGLIEKAMGRSRLSWAILRPNPSGATSRARTG